MDTGLVRGASILVCTTMVWLVSALSVSMPAPAVYSPFSLPVVIPSLIVSMLALPHILIAVIGALPHALLFAVSMFWGSAKDLRISNMSVLLITVIGLFAMLFNALGFQRGIEFQGLWHTLVIVSLNVIFVSALPILFWQYRNRPSLLRYLGFFTLFFVWIGFSAFPWFGALL